MKVLLENISLVKAQRLKKLNNEYLFWNDNSEISVHDIERKFMVTQYENGSINLEHKKDDFRIEDILFKEKHTI